MGGAGIHTRLLSHCQLVGLPLHRVGSLRWSRALLVAAFVALTTCAVSAIPTSAGPSDQWYEWNIETNAASTTTAGAPLTSEPARTIPEMICQYDDWCPAAIRVAECESSLNPLATDGFNDGLFQIAHRYHTRRLAPGESLFDPAVNVRVAHEIWLEQGSSPWPSCGRFWR